MKETFEVELAERMIKLIAKRVEQKIKEQNKGLFEITIGEIFDLIDDVSIVNFNWYCSNEDERKIFNEVAKMLNEE